MSRRLSSLLHKEFRPFRPGTALSAFTAKCDRVLRILFLTALCLFVVWRVFLYFDVNSRLAKIRAAGLPTSGAELNAWRRPVPDEENGALVLTQAFALVCTAPGGRSNEVMAPQVLSRTNQWSSEMHALVEAYVQTNAPALARARQAVPLSRFRYPVDFSYGPDTQLAHLAHLSTLARIAGLKAALDAEEGHPDAWPEPVELGLKLAGTLDEEPAVMSYLARSRIIAMAVKATERGLNRATPGDEACKRLQAAFIHAGRTNLLPLAFVGERGLIIPAFRLSWKEIQSSSHSDEPGAPPRKPQRYSGTPNPFLWLTGFFERDLDFYLKTMEKSTALAAVPLPGSLILTNYLDAGSKKALKRHYILSATLLPSISTVLVREASTQALIKLATTALAVERFRRDRGRPPGKLEELTPQFLDIVPTDPFDGAPLRYRLLASGYVIYSVGADGHDDGGREPPERKKLADKTSYDITFIVEH